MTPFAKPILFVDHAGNFPRTTLAKAKAVGFGALAIRGQSGIWTDEPDSERRADPQRRRLNPADVVRLRDDARAQGFAVTLWVVLDLGNDWTGWSMDEAARVTSDYSRHFDGVVVNAEAVLQQTGPYLSWLSYTGPLALSTLPTFAMSETVRLWDNRQAWLMQQGYSIEQGHTPLSCRHWALGGTATNGITYPPLRVGWNYRGSVLGKPRRLFCVGEDWMGYKVTEFGNTWGLDPDSRRIFNRQTRKVVGKLAGLWGPNRFAPTIRTTKVGYDFLSAAEIRAQRAEVPGAPVGAYLGESTEEEQWSGWT